ncbi:MAG: hypothetical protein ABEI52_01620, partial [Halobacteriaceae archaeon]
DPSEAPPDLKRAFLAAVLLANLSLLTLSIGAMIVWFQRAYLLGIGLIVVGILAGTRTYLIYRRERYQ